MYKIDSMVLDARADPIDIHKPFSKTTLKNQWVK